MFEVTGIRFKRVGKIYYFDPGDLVLKSGDHVIVETSRGIEYGTVVIAKKSVTDDEIVPPLKKSSALQMPMMTKPLPKIKKWKKRLSGFVRKK